mmetsp:Transcript_22048/g.25388  ORF Transcript_22048/g.25388 Transcript_22048/m.25388 type:complete len:456 (+) Transcript_22048:193-1560(+)
MYHPCLATVPWAVIITTAAATLFDYSNGGDGGIGTTSMNRRDIVNAPCISAFQLNLEYPIETDASNRALSLIQNTYRQDYYNSSISHHHFVRTAPGSIQDTLSEFVWSDSALKQARTKFDATGATSRNNNGGDAGVRVIHDVFDEIYIMRREFDLLDEKKIHYDGNLKLPGICTIRALTYLSGKDATLVALTSQQNYTTRNHSSIVLDFDRELHYVSLVNNPNNNLAPLVDRAQEAAVGGRQRRNEPRVMIKSAIHVVLPGTYPLVAYLHIILHRTMVFAARSFRRTFESQSQSQSKPQSDTPSKSNVSMMAVDNLMRSMNKIHMILPLLLIGIPLGAIFLAPVFYPLQFFPYVALVIARCLLTRTWSRFFMAWILLVNGLRLFGTTRWNNATNIRLTDRKFQNSNVVTRLHIFCLIVLHTGWIGVCYYIEANADMAKKILLAPWQPIMNLDDIV